MSGYIFVHFTGEQKDGEQIYFSISRDGLHWKDLNYGKPILYSETGMKGVRDPFVVRDPKNHRFFLIATDLRIEAGEGWEKAQYDGSRDLMVWESEDLIHWGKERACTVGVPGAGCVWAPEAVYDKKKEAFLVFWASMVKLEADQEPKQRIYASWTKGFREYTEPFIYMEREEHVIDTTIIEADDMYYRISKDESNKCLILEKSRELTGEYEEISSEVLKHLMGVEGPECYPLPEGKGWCLIADRFAEGKGYLPLVTTDPGSGKFTILSDGEYHMGATQKRHGGVMVLEDGEYEQLERFFDRKYPVIDGLFADPDVAVFDDKFYIYPTTDGYPGWSGSRFSVFASEDGRHFTKAGEVLDMDQGQVPWAVGSAWAPCIAKKGDTYYYYFCGKRPDGVSCIGVATADRPEGPFRAEKEPLITPEMMEANRIRMSQTIDPSVYEENGTWYLLFGNGEGAIAKLTEDMKSVCPDTMKNLEGLYDFREAVTVFKKDGLYHFTWSCDDTGSENYHVNYGTAKQLYGPVQFEKTILKKDVRRGVLGTGHHSICKIPEKEEYVIAYHRFATPLEQYDSDKKGWNRETCLAPLVFGKDGKIEAVLV